MFAVLSSKCVLGAYYVPGTLHWLSGTQTEENTVSSCRNLGLCQSIEVMLRTWMSRPFIHLISSSRRPLVFKLTGPVVFAFCKALPDPVFPKAGWPLCYLGSSALP